MKIIKRGSLPGERVYVGTCKNCDTTMEAFRSDLKGNYDFRDNVTILSAKCMLCGSTTHFRPKPPSTDYDDPENSFAYHMGH